MTHSANYNRSLPMHFPFAGRVATACLLVAFSAGVSQAQNPGAGATEVTFPTSAGAEAQRTFLTGLAWLHSFEYEQALESFQQAQMIEPGFAMAYWGEAICYQQFLWGNENPAIARDILARYAVTPAARAARTS